METPTLDSPAAESATAPSPGLTFEPVFTTPGTSPFDEIEPESDPEDRVAAALGTAYMDVPCSHCGSKKVIRAGKPSVRRATRFYRNASRCLRDSPSSIIATTTLLML